MRPSHSSGRGWGLLLVPSSGWAPWLSACLYTSSNHPTSLSVTPGGSQMPCSVSFLRQARYKPAPGVALREGGTLGIWSNSSASQGETWSWGFPPSLMACTRGGDYGKRGFLFSLLVLMQLNLHLLRMQEPLNWFPDFSQRVLIRVMLLNHCVCGEKESSGFLFHHLADIKSFSLSF